MNLANPMVPADGRITLSDFGTRDWGPELVHYRLDTDAFPPGKLLLKGPGGDAVPFQIENGVLAFVAVLPKGESVTYTLEKSDRDRSSENTTLEFRESAQGIEVANEFLGLRLPPTGETRFVEPVAAATATPPLLQWKTSANGWIGGTRFSTTRSLVSQAFTVVRRGPACFEFEARYAFEPRGGYLLRVRLSPNVPLAVVTEEFDLGETTSGGDYLLVDLHKGWTPENIGLLPGTHEQLLPGLVVSDYAAYLERMLTEKSPSAPVGGVGDAPVLPDPEPGLLALQGLFPAARWGGLLGALGVWDGEDKKHRALGVMTLHVGAWRRAMLLRCWQRQGTGLLLGLPIGVRPARWCYEVTDDYSPFSTHEHDGGLPRTYGRREWALASGVDLESTQPHFGHIGLDRYKNWILDWPESDTPRSGAWFDRSHVGRLRHCLDRHPSADRLRDRYLISGNPKDAVRHARQVIDLLKKPTHPRLENDFLVSGLTNYRKSQLLAFVNEAEDALACPELPAELRRELRVWLALYAHVTSEPDWHARGSGGHLGNNNMPINRTLALAYFAALLPDHPMHAFWMESVESFTRMKLATQFSPGGESLECPTYQLYAPAGAFNIALNILRNGGRADPDLENVIRRNLQYLANLTLPDPRFGGARILPGMGNGPNQRESVWGVSMALFAATDPEFAGWCRGMFLASGGEFEVKDPIHGNPVNGGSAHITPYFFIGHPLHYLPDIPVVEPEFRTIFLPAYGVAFRAHASTGGGGAGETAMLLRAGCNWGHWDTDALNVILFAKGAPLSPGTGYQYYAGIGTKGDAIYHNQVKVGSPRQQEVFGRVDCTVRDHGFGDSCDYAVAERHHPAEIFADSKGPMAWRRHILFLKSETPAGPSYFVMRDTFPLGGDRAKWWTWMNLGLPGNVRVDGEAFDDDCVPVESPVAEEEMPTLRGRVLEMATEYGAGTWFWFDKPREFRVRAVMSYQSSHGADETKTVLEAPADAHEDYFYTVFPRKDGEAAPACESLADGVLRITTGESRDTVFVSDEPFAHDHDGVVFSGKAGAVRLFKDRVVLSMNAGTGRVGYRGMIFEGHGPFEKVVPLAGMKPGVTRIKGGYEKEIAAVDIGGGITVRGERPFEARLDGSTIRISTRGRARVLHVTQPPFIIRPQYWIDGREHMASWTDLPANGWGTYGNSWLIALPVPEGEHELVVKDFEFTDTGMRSFVPLLKPDPQDHL